MEKKETFENMINAFANMMLEEDEKTVPVGNTAVICGFPGVGKSHIFNNYNKKALSWRNGKSYTILDSDSSNFSWVKDENGNNTKERNPEFPQNYITHIKENIGKADVIFVSSHKEVRDALREAGISFFLVYPTKDMKDIFLEKYKNRGSSDAFIKMIDEKWDEFLTQLEEETHDKICFKYPLSKERPHLTIDTISDFLDTGTMGLMYFMWCN